jgi:hypothetical protein
MRVPRFLAAKRIVVGSALILAACTESPAGNNDIGGAFVETRLHVDVVDGLGAPVVSATVAVTNPLSSAGSVWTRSTNSLGRAVFLERAFDAREWMPVSITVQPPAGSGLAPRVRPDSMRFQLFQANPHVVVIVLDSL